MKYKTIEAMRQTRLMITEVLVPGAMICITAYNIPAVKKEIDQKVETMIKKHKEKKTKKFKVVK